MGQCNVKLNPRASCMHQNLLITAILSFVVIMNKLLPCNGQNSQLFLARDCVVLILILSCCKKILTVSLKLRI